MCKLHKVVLPDYSGVPWVPTKDELQLKLAKEENNHVTGRLSVIKDPECKMRVIAIIDYYSQFTLKPIHDQLLNLLRRIPMDRTYTQDPHHN